MKISVIIPTYKPQDYLWECLDSLAAQTFPKKEFEVLVILNGCCQPYRDQIEKYISSADPSLNIKLIHTDKGGVSNARNIGLDLAQGEFIAFIDDDDKVSPEYLQELHERADETTVVISNTYDFKDDCPDSLVSVRPTELHGILSAKGRSTLIDSRRFFFTVWMKLIPAAVIGDRRFDTSFKMGEDSIFMFRISDRIRNTDFTSSKAIYYRRLRCGSAMDIRNKTSWIKNMWNDIRMIAAYTRIYLLGLRRYSIRFYITRVRGAIHF